MAHITRVHGGDDGETRLSTLELPLTEDQTGSGVSIAQIPIASTLSYVEYPPGDIEMVPGFHCAPQRQFVMSVQGSFEVTATSGDTKLFEPGDWLLADDVGTKGHLTKGVGPDRRINAVIAVPEEWPPPGF